MVRAFLLGIYEFRRDCTTSFVGQPDEQSKYNWYDRGRELAHKVTRRRYDYDRYPAQHYSSEFGPQW